MPDATPKQSKEKKASVSGNTTPTHSKSKGFSAIIHKITQSDRKKSELKKAKKLLESGSRNDHRGKGRKLSLPDTPPQPLGHSHLQPPMSSIGADGDGAIPLTPPIPPRRPPPRTSDKSDSRVAAPLPVVGGIVTRKRVPKPLESPQTIREQKQSDLSGIESSPPKPAKRQRLSMKNDVDESPDQTLLNGNSLQESASILQSLQPAQTSLPYMYDSLQEASKLFDCLIHPVKASKFFTELWEQKPLLVKRHRENYNEGWFSSAELDRILRENRLEFTKNIDVVSYVNQKRETHNPVGRAYAPVVWDYYQNGCSVRVLNPQTYSHNVWKLLSILQEYFGCMVGANIYLTPPGTQGFAPHYDDIEAFILQLEGKKHWRLYSPRNENEALPRFSSPNFTEADIGPPILNVMLEAGDILYFPRGTIHQGRTVEDTHSLHITVSCMQKNSWADLLQQLVPRALSMAAEEDIDFRKSLPKDYLNYMGVAFSDTDSPARAQFLRTVEGLMKKLVTSLPVDAACDQMGKQYIQDGLPPVLTQMERECSIHGNGEHWLPNKQCVSGAVEIEPDTEVKLIRKGCLRLLSEDDRVVVYHNLENARVYRESEAQCIEISAEFAPAVEHLLHNYPEYVNVDDLPLETVQERVELASALYDKGLLLTSRPLEPVSDEQDSGSCGEQSMQ